jgi:catechol 2,3-dioxygenase-like lactoylglutathione lyase family enzyme
MLVLLTWWLALAQAVQLQQPTSTSAPAVQAVLAISTTVADMDRSVGFYTKVLSFRKTADREVELGPSVKAKQVAHARVVSLTLEDESIELVQFENAKARPVPRDARSNDLWFQHIAIIVSDMDRAYMVLKANHVEAASVAPQRLPEWNKNAAGIRAFYFKDPDGHPLEILQFPAGKGDPKWHRQSGGIFLGIDHTAIVISNTEASLKFYRDVLGMRVAGTSENYGPEQEALNNVRGAHLRITTLRAQQGPGIELLEYLSPRARRKLPYQPALSDLVHRQTVVLSEDPTRLLKALALSEHSCAGEKAFAVRDPDGHELLIRSAEPNPTIGEVK